MEGKENEKIKGLANIKGLTVKKIPVNTPKSLDAAKVKILKSAPSFIGTISTSYLNYKPKLSPFFRASSSASSTKINSITQSEIQPFDFNTIAAANNKNIIQPFTSASSTNLNSITQSEIQPFDFNTLAAANNKNIIQPCSDFVTPINKNQSRKRKSTSSKARTVPKTVNTSSKNKNQNRFDIIEDVMLPKHAQVPYTETTSASEASDNRKIITPFNFNNFSSNSQLQPFNDEATEPNPTTSTPKPTTLTPTPTTSTPKPKQKSRKVELLRFHGDDSDVDGIGNNSNVVDVMATKIGRMEAMMKITHKFVVAQQIKNSQDFDNILPITDEEQLYSIEEVLGRDVDYRSSFINYVKGLKADNCANLNVALQAVIKDNVSCLFNYAGICNKRAFQDLNLCKALFAAWKGQIFGLKEFKTELTRALTMGRNRIYKQVKYAAKN